MNNLESQSLFKMGVRTIRKLIGPTCKKDTDPIRAPTVLKRKTSISLVISALTSALMALLTISPAHAISGGTVSSLPWVVHIVGLEKGSDDVVTTCSGAQINDLMVITAKHCNVIQLLFPDGRSTYIASAHEVPGADVQVVVMDQEHPLEKYPTLGPDYMALNRLIPAGTAAVLYGYGSGPKEWPQKSLRMVMLEHGTLMDDSTVDILRTRESDGQTQNGDSGGPLVVNGLLVGLHKQPLKDADGQRVIELSGLSKALSVIRQLQHAREMRAIKEETYYPGPWISAVDVVAGKLSVTMSSQLLKSGDNVVMWVNGKYVANVKNDTAFHSSKTDTPGGAIISPDITVRDGDLVQLGIGSETGTPQTSTLLFEKRVSGIEAVMLQNGRAVVRVSPTLVSSGQRVIIWMNGVYRSEVYKNNVYYGDGFARSGAGVTIYVGAATPETKVQIGVVSGTPGDAFGTPAASKLLYSATLDGKLETLSPSQPSYTIVGTGTSAPEPWPATVNFPTKTSPARR